MGKVETLRKGLQKKGQIICVAYCAGVQYVSANAKNQRRGPEPLCWEHCIKLSSGLLRYNRLFSYSGFCFVLLLCIVHYICITGYSMIFLYSELNSVVCAYQM